MWIRGNYWTTVQIPKNPVLDLKAIPLLRNFILSLHVWTWENYYYYYYFFRKMYLVWFIFIFYFLIEKIIRSPWHSAQFSHIHNGSHHNSSKHDFFPQIEVEIVLNRIMKDYIKSQYGASPCHSCEDLNTVGCLAKHSAPLMFQVEHKMVPFILMGGHVRVNNSFDGIYCHYLWLALLYAFHFIDIHMHTHLWIHIYIYIYI